VVLEGHADDPEMTPLQRFFVRNSYPHRIAEVSAEREEDASDESEPPAVVLSDGRVLFRPSIMEVADVLGINDFPDSGMTSMMWPSLVQDRLVSRLQFMPLQRVFAPL